MIEVIFKAENISDLKLQIQEYSLCHLGLNFKAMADQMVSDIKKSGEGRPGVTEEVRLNDGTIRLHNPSYPGGMKTDELPKKRGRKLGWRKQTEESVEGAAQSIELKEKAKSAIHALATKKGVDKAVEALKKYDAAHLDEVSPENYQALADHCVELENG